MFCLKAFYTKTFEPDSLSFFIIQPFKLLHGINFEEILKADFIIY